MNIDEEISRTKAIMDDIMSSIAHLNSKIESEKKNLKANTKTLKALERLKAKAEKIVS